MSTLQSCWAHLSFTLITASLMIGVFIVMRRLAKRLQGPRIVINAKERAVADQQVFVITSIASLAIAAATSAIRIGDVDLAGYLIAYSGELSFATIFFWVVTLGGNLLVDGWRVGKAVWRAPQWGWTIGGLAIYTVALSGRGPDLYSLGYGSLLAWVGLAISAAAAIGQRWLIASLSLGIVLAWQFRLTGAVNLWDYALDPFIFVGSVVQTSARVCGTCARVGTKWRAGRKLQETTIDVVPKAA